MSTKPRRQASIRRLVRSQEISTQEQLRRLLRKTNFEVDQATLSRDLAELGVRKIAGRYAFDRNGQSVAAEADSRTVADFVHDFATCGPHLIVIRTSIGQAQAVGLAIDKADDPSIVATLAGDDTVFVATKSQRTQSVAMRRLENWFGDKHARE